MRPLLRNPELERVILDDPLDPDAWLVYGDWLESEGDPRGELVAVQARLARDPGNPALMTAQRTLFAQSGDALLEGLDPFLKAGINEDDGSPTNGPLIRLSWEFGFLWTASLVANGGHSLHTFIKGLRALLTHPSAHFLHALSLGSPPDNAWDDVIDLMSSSADHQEQVHPCRLLFLGDSLQTSFGNPRPGYAPLGDMSSLWSSFPHLRHLALRGGVMKVGALALPSLRELTIETGALDRKTLQAIGNRDWPELEKLEVWFGERRCMATLPDLTPIFEGATRFPKLRHLGLRNCAFVDRICSALAGAPITEQLHVLDLSLGALTEVGLSALVNARTAFEHLAVLDLHHHYVPFNRVESADVKALARFVDVSGYAVVAPAEGDDDDEARSAGRVWLDV